MKQVLKFAAALCVALVLVMGVRAVAFSLCRVPSDIGRELRRGDRVWVNKLARTANFSRGDIVVFDTSGTPPCISLYNRDEAIGCVVAVPGDTITVAGRRYRIPYRCCDRCGCDDCRLYLVDTGHGCRLVHKHQIVGRGRRFL
jgi:signal peptidase I